MGDILKKTLLIADDISMNRAILAEMFKDTYTIAQADNGLDALEQLKNDSSIVIVLLDIIMPKADGFYVLEQMKALNMLSHIPVIFITGEADSVEYQRRGYQLGVTDIISKPFDEVIVRQRVANSVALYESKNNNEALVHKLTAKIQRINDEIINGFSSLVESRNKESKLHIIHIRKLTKILLDELAATNPVEFSPILKDKIIRASALHDIGKYMIPDHILNKPKSEGRFTAEEYEIMKVHTVQGCNILQSFFKDIFNDDPVFYNFCIQIVRSHHERWDGNGYPDHLTGNDIPFAAQLVSIADVYDALVSERCYKDAYPHEQAIKMIMQGECGAFNPVLLSSLDRVQELYRTALAEPILV